MVVVKDVIESSKLDFLNEKMLKDAYDLSNRGENSPFNYNKGYTFPAARPMNNLKLNLTLNV